MSQSRSLSTLRTITKRLIFCLLLGAVLQYLVAAAFGLHTSYGKIDRAWHLDDPRFRTWSMSQNPYGNSLAVYQYSSNGREVLRATFEGVNASTDWSHSVWSQQVLVESVAPNASLQIETSPNNPPFKSRFSQLRTDPSFDYHPNASLNGDCIEVTCGWPRRCASYFAGAPKLGAPYTVRDGLMLSNTSSWPTVTPRVIPLAIHWPGTIANTLLYAAVLFIPITLVPIARKNCRRRAGHCPTCNYDLRGTDHVVCPECGK